MIAAKKTGECMSILTCKRKSAEPGQMRSVYERKDEESMAGATAHNLRDQSQSKSRRGL
jgi:hypothetical protein